MALSRRKALGSVVAVASAVALSLGGLTAVGAPTTPNPLAGHALLPSKYFVQVAGQPTFKGGSAAANKAAQDKVLKAIANAGIKAGVNASFVDAYNGLSLTVSQTQAVGLARVPGVVKVYPVLTTPIPKTTAVPQLKYAVQMTGAKAANVAGYTGKGIKVGIIDTGIDIQHPDLNPTGAFPSARIVAGYDFVGDNYDANGVTGSVIPTPDAYPDDCNGHGTHVAGIVGANGVVKGVAPDVLFGAYRVFGCEGSVDDDVLLKAMERAATDGMNVVNMSLGSGYASWPDYPDALAADALAARGVIVVDSAGNEGDGGTFSTGSPSTGANSISVASYDNTVVTSKAIQLGPSGAQFSYAPGENAQIPTTGTYPLVSAGPDAAVTTGTEPVGDCLNSPTPLPDLHGKVLLVKRGFCTFQEKALRAQAAGAVGIIIYNREEALLTPAIDATVTIPAVIITLSDGLTAQAAIAAGGATISYTNVLKEVANPTAGLVSDFSSMGLAADLSLKPDLGAPGGSIWSTFPIEKGGYASLSGTSMASPHVAGAVALVLEAHPELKGKFLAVRELLQNTARQTMWKYGPSYGYLDPTTSQGAGLINVYDAILTTSTVSPGKVSLGEGAKGVTTTFTLTNNSGADVTYTLSDVGTLSTKLTTLSKIDWELDQATLSYPAAVTVPAHSALAVPVAFTEPATVNGTIYGGFIRFTDGDTVLSVPYAGMAGDYQAETVMTDAFLLRYNPATGLADTKVSTGYRFSGKGLDTPYFGFHLEYPASAITAYLYSTNKDGTKGSLMGQILDEGKTGRDNSYLSFTATATYAAMVGGRLVEKTAPAGTYLMEIRVQKPLSDPALAASWEVKDLLFTVANWGLQKGTLKP